MLVEISQKRLAQDNITYMVNSYKVTDFTLITSSSVVSL